MTRRPTLMSVAQLAGVSTPTVSKVLNGRDDVAPGTRSRVRQALDELGYESPVQRRMHQTGPALVDLVFDGLKTPYSIELLRGIIGHSAGQDVEIVLSQVTPAQLRRIDTGEWAARVAGSGRKGLILVTSEVSESQLREFDRHGVPVVVIDPLNPPRTGLVSVGATNWAGGKAATEHLIGLGHTRIAHMGGPAAAECSQARLHGFFAAMMAHGIPVDSDYLTDGSFDTATGVRAMERLLELDTPPTAVFAGNDAIALGALQVARSRGVRVPADMSIVGFDGTHLAEHAVPPLTSVAQPLQDMGRTALRTIIRLAGGESLESYHVELATELVIRESTAAPPDK
ncbi:LacI family DNA-binding transcriptional regulator [Spelaeicoccus albus]|uniref:LacI family transcriptional regulator n=1 Tax=Spelaeicoccus albus TaxID=1280376 RepID=A0A7Z0ACN5_9MICO|nr:LacI family DNA-binding transcriptional regulator [Spelaeicoccus albus]NYI66831.1 LacI family transcriptional regulator [Spelaeicoccus albus]